MPLIKINETENDITELENSRDQLKILFRKRDELTYKEDD
jgi:hypothetical protein